MTIEKLNDIKLLFVNAGYEQLQNVKINILQTPLNKNNSSCHGFTKSKFGEKTKINDNYELIQVIPEYIQISVKGVSFNNLIFILLHEFGHCIAKVELHKNEKTNEWLNEYHGDEFYKSFAKILRDAELLNIYKLSFITKNKFSLQGLKKIDSLCLYENKIDIGKQLVFEDGKKIRLNLIYNNQKKTILVDDKKKIHNTIKNSFKLKKFNIYDVDDNEITIDAIKNDMMIFIK